MTPEPGAPPNRYQAASLVMLGMNVLGVLFLIFIGLFTVPKFKAIFMDLMGSSDSLPTLTRLFIMQPSSVYLGWAVGFMLVLFLKEFLMDRKGVTFVINFAAMVLQLIVTGAVVMSCFMPMHTLVQGMSEPSTPPTGVQQETATPSDSSPETTP